MPSKDDTKAPLRLLRLPEVTARTGHPTSTVYALMASGDFPRPVKTGPRSVGWVEHEIESWNQRRIAARDAGDTWTSLGDTAAKVIKKLELPAQPVGQRHLRRAHKGE